MTINKRAKSSRQRGSHTHGCGSMKKRRGAGHRGGRGNAGTGKRGDAKKPSFWKNKKYYGKHGFHSHAGIEVNAINIGVLNSTIDTLISKGKAKLNDGVYTLILSDLKYNKILGSGIVSCKLNIECDYASKKAIEKVEAAGGKVTLLSTEDAE